ncbi:cation-efflux pump [Acidicapsa ligni]|uniref:cation-efflux pump n=1 Tax=Acidicapsa ligni TaxID=542300 RepID=UPI0021E0137C|nr:cation-efflux pump [Acidicapsa ligni]
MSASTLLPEMTAAKRRVAMHSMLAAAAMTALKLAAGLLSGSLGVLSDGAHSGLDLIGSALTFFSVRVSDKPADEDHTYGHAKFENLSAFVEAGLMAISCAWIIWEAMQRIFHHDGVVHFSIWPVLVLVTSIVVDYWRSRQLRAVALQYNSTALAADAFHFASDIWSTLAVLAGLILSWIGSLAGIGWLSYADPVAAILVSLMILRLTWKLTRETSAVLLDAAPAETRQKILRAVKAVDGVLAIEQARVRRAGSSTFADLTLALPRSFTFEHTGELVRAATEAVQRVVPEVDVVIHTVPRESSTESIFDRIRAVAARNNVAVHEVSVQSIRGKLRVEQHVELNESLTLAAAHTFVTAMEKEILRDVPELDDVITHIESEPATIERPQPISKQGEQESEAVIVERSLRTVAANFPEIIDVHEILVGRSAEHIQISCHCTLPDALTMRRVHEIITNLEDRLKLQCPEVSKVLIHPEPETDNHR